MPAAGVQPQMVAALGADLEVGFEIGFEDILAATRALYPEALGAHPLLGVAFDLIFGALEPGHCFPFAARACF